jgi:hypothetical protein
VVDVGGLSLMEVVWGWVSVSGSLAGRVASTVSAPPSRFLPTTLGCGDKESVDGAIVW